MLSSAAPLSRGEGEADRMSFKIIDREVFAEEDITWRGVRM